MTTKDNTNLTDQISNYAKDHAYLELKTCVFKNHFTKPTINPKCNTTASIHDNNNQSNNRPSTQ